MKSFFITLTFLIGSVASGANTCSCVAYPENALWGYGLEILGQNGEKVTVPFPNQWRQVGSNEGGYVAAERECLHTLKMLNELKVCIAHFK